MRKTTAIAVAASLSWVPLVAHSQVQQRAIDGAGSIGTRTSGAADFTLLEHGIWNSPMQAQQTVPDQVRGKPGGIQSRRRTSFARGALLPLVYSAETRHGLPSGLLDALIWTESRYNMLATSKVGAAGLAQLMPATASDMGVINRYDPRQSIDGGARYLRRMIDRFGSVHLALAAYNAGPTAVDRRGGIPLNGETPQYVARVMNYWLRFTP